MAEACWTAGRSANGKQVEPTSPDLTFGRTFLSIENERLDRYGYARQDFAGLDRRVRLMQVAHGARKESRHAGTAASRPAAEVDRHRMLLGQLKQRRCALAPQGGHARAGECYVKPTVGLRGRSVKSLFDRCRTESLRMHPVGRNTPGFEISRDGIHHRGRPADIEIKVRRGNRSLHSSEVNVSGMNARIIHRAGRPRIEDMEVDIGVGSGDGLQVRAHDVLSLVADAIEEP